MEKLPILKFTSFEKCCKFTNPICHGLSRMFAILANTQDESRHHISPNVSNLGMTFSDAQKERILAFTYKASISIGIQETGFKIVSRCYKVPSLLHKSWPLASLPPPLCLRGSFVCLFLYYPVSPG